MVFDPETGVFDGFLPGTGSGSGIADFADVVAATDVAFRAPERQDGCAHVRAPHAKDR